MKSLSTLAWALLVIGGLNWGLVGLANFNLVFALFGTSILATIVYVLVGLAALVSLYDYFVKE